MAARAWGKGHPQKPPVPWDSTLCLVRKESLNGCESAAGRMVQKVSNRGIASC